MKGTMMKKLCQGRIWKGSEGWIAELVSGADSMKFERRRTMKKAIEDANVMAGQVGWVMDCPWSKAVHSPMAGNQPTVHGVGGEVGTNHTEQAGMQFTDTAPENPELDLGAQA